MIEGGNASIYVSNMDASVEFFTQVVGLRLRTRVGTDWAEIEAGKGFVIGLHPAHSGKTVDPGTRGAINVELNVTRPMEEVVDALKAKGVEFDGPILSYEFVKIATFKDPDGNAIVLGEVLNTSNPE
ncbi:VOC family protein [Planctomycetota bacterium]|nr:VOC family protein [Planctomycetota bacterium]